MIRSFADKDAADIFDQRPSKKLPRKLVQVVVRKLAMLHAADSLDDLRSPPGNRLEKLAGERKGQHSVRINKQYRICFVWRDGDAHNVEIVDYH